MRCRGPVEDHDLKAVGRKMAGHGIAHDAETDEGDAHDQAASACALLPRLRGSRPIERAMISRMISELPA